MSERISEGERERENEVIRHGEFVLSDHAARKVNHGHYTHFVTFLDEHAAMSSSGRGVRIYTEEKELDESKTSKSIQELL